MAIRVNTELKDDLPFDALWKELMTNYRFAYCDSLTDMLHLPPILIVMTL